MFKYLSQRLLVYIFGGIAALLLAGCNPTPSTITYEQVGACNANQEGAQDHLAFVFFRVQSIDNSKTNVGYTFHAKDLWLNTGDQFSGYEYVATGQQSSLYGLSPLLAPINVAANATLPINKYVVFLLETVDADGPNEANHTSYFFNYHTPANEVGKLLIRSNANQTSWPNTHRCADIHFAK